MLLIICFTILLIVTYSKISFKYTIQPKTNRIIKPVSKSTIYTRNGDKGITSLYSGKAVNKSDSIIVLLASLDYLSSYIGLVKSYCISDSNTGNGEIFDVIQRTLLDIGSCIATPPDTKNKKKVAKTRFNSAYIEELEKSIDFIDSQLPTLTNFILLSGNVITCNLFIARAICRDTETKLYMIDRPDLDEVKKYINRLSDWLFVMGRIMNDLPEVTYKKQT